MYDGDGNETSMNASTGTVWEDTHYVYGVNTSQGSLVDSNDLLYKVGNETGEMKRGRI
jgi:hypothetical protein